MPATAVADSGAGPLSTLSGGTSLGTLVVAALVAPIDASPGAGLTNTALLLTPAPGAALSAGALATVPSNANTAPAHSQVQSMNVARGLFCTFISATP